MHLPHPKIARHDFLHSQDEEPRDNVLVTVFLRGGADGLTLVPPVSDDAYHAARPTLSVSSGDAIDLNGYFALNPSLAPLKRVFDAGQMMIVHGAGSEDNTRSHFEAQDTMEHAGAEGGSGWLGRFMRAREPVPAALSAVAIGTTRPESLRGAPAGAGRAGALEGDERLRGHGFRPRRREARGGDRARALLRAPGATRGRQDR